MIGEGLRGTLQERSKEETGDEETGSGRVEGPGSPEQLAESD